MIPLHEIRDPAKLQRLIESISAHGWQGAPLVTWDCYLLTGTHRYAACQALGWVDADIPTIDISDVYAEAGLDWDALWHDYDCPTMDQWGVVESLLRELPPTVRRKYGIDAV